MSVQSDTIAAISTPPGTGGIGIIRISGPDAFGVAGRIFRARNGANPCDMAGYTSALGKIHDGGAELDEALCQIFRAPKSYTGENVAELSCHGGSWITRRALRLCLENGARAAEPGEFTKRAFLNGKLKLTEAEAVMDLIYARSQSAARAALSAKDGAITRSVGEITRILLSLSAHLSAWADFPDEDLESPDTADFLESLECCIGKVRALLKTYDSGRILRDGVSTAIVGRPNVGKSTLMNLLSGHERSIVTEIPGTTRDVVEESISLGDIVLTLSDTAGIRGTSDPVERQGVLRSRERISSSELILAVFDGSQWLTDDDEALLSELEGKNCIAVINKADLPKKLDTAGISSAVKRVVAISAKNGEGKRELEREITDFLGLSMIDNHAAIIANERQRMCLFGAEGSLCEAKSAYEAGNMLDAVSVCVDYALDGLLALTGERVTDRVVDEVFSRFCVGK